MLSSATAAGRFLCGARGERGELLRRCLRIDARAPVAPEHRRQRVGTQMPEQHLHIRQRQRAAAPVTGRPRIRARGGGTHGEAAVAVAEHRAPAGGDAVHIQHRLGEAHAADQVLEALRQLAVDQRHVGRGAAHVEADEARVVEALAHPAHADQPAGRPRQHARHGVEARRDCQAAVALHQAETRARIERAQLLLQRAQVAAQRQCEVGIEHRGVAARDVAHQRRQLVRHRYLLEPERSCAPGGEALVLRVPPAVQEHDGDRAASGAARARQVGAQARGVERREHRAVRIDALVRLDDARIQPLRQHDVTREDVGAVLVADAQAVGEARRGHQHHRLAGAGEQRVGGDRGADLHRRDRRTAAGGRRGGRLGKDGACGGEARIARVGAADRGHLAHVQRPRG